MGNIVYILGAGFSAPLGLPVMSNFLVKSKDLFFSNMNKYNHFEKVFESVYAMSYMKNYYNSDLFNIEEILSILEMDSLTTGIKNKVDFKKYIIDVIDGYTPIPTSKATISASNWYDSTFNGSTTSQIYGHFILELLNINIRNMNNLSLDAIKKSKIDNNYSVISLNYDMVIENYLNLLENMHKFKVDVVDGIEANQTINYNKFNFSKLHGCISKGNIVPPTWSKNSNSEIEKSWILASKLLQEANEIRILGFSLPITDSYLKYLFKSSVLNSKNLKKIEVVNLDSTGQSKLRYDNFIHFGSYKYINGDISEYLELNYENFKNRIRFISNRDNDINSLELTHNNFMKDNFA